MKKILLATTLLVATSGIAAAEVALSGSARMGLIHNGTDTLFTSRVRVNFSMSGETDGGLSFGAAVRNDQSGQGNTANGDSTVFISGAFGKLTFGDTDSAANALVGHVSGVGLTGLSDLNELRYFGSAKTAALYEYSTGQITFAVSAGQTNSVGNFVAGPPVVETFGNNVSVAVKYATDQFTVALGYESREADTDGTAAIVLDDQSHLALGASATFGAATVKAVISDTDIAGDATQYAVSLDYTAGPTVFTVFATDEGTVNNYGIGASYDLGGGAKVVGGIVSDDRGVSRDTIADLGLSFSF